MVLHMTKKDLFNFEDVNRAVAFSKSKKIYKKLYLISSLVEEAKKLSHGELSAIVNELLRRYVASAKRKKHASNKD
jgi:hypothetical protein